MATTAILPKRSAPAALTITLASLASGSARQASIVDNSTTRYQRIYLAAKLKLGTSPTANTLVSLYLIRSDGTITTDGAGSSDAAITLKNAQTLGTLSTGGSPATSDTLTDVFVVENPGPQWTVAVLNSTGAALDATAGNHLIEWVGEYLEIQA